LWCTTDQKRPDSRRDFGNGNDSDFVDGDLRNFPQSIVASISSNLTSPAASGSRAGYRGNAKLAVALRFKF
jgi:hypothetical protein